MTKPPEPGPRRPLSLPAFASATFPSGLRARAARWGKRPTLAAALFFPGAGSVSDPVGREGTADIVAESLLGGTARRSSRELAEAIDDLAALVDITAGADSGIARLFVLQQDLHAGLELLAEIVARPSFPDEEVEKSRRRQIDLLAEQRSEPDFLARERLLDRLYPGHPYGRLTASEAGLLALTRGDVLDFHRSRFDLSKGHLILVGDAEPQALLAAGERVFGALPGRNGSPAEPPRAPAIDGFSLHLVNRPGSVQTNLLFARPALRRSDPRFPAALVANQALGGGASARLFLVLREERGLTYGAFSSLVPRVAAGHFTASIDCRTEVTDEALGGLLDLIRRFADEGPSEAEHRRAIDYLVGSFALARETPGAIAQDEITRLLHGLPEDEWLTWRDRVSAVTRDEAREAARQLFDSTRGVVAAVGDAAKIRGILERYGETTLWDADGPRG